MKEVCRVFVYLPVHPQMFFVVDLQPVHTEIFTLTVKRLRIDLPHRNERSAILRPGFENRQIVKVDCVTRHDMLLTGPFAREAFGKDIFEVEEFCEHAKLLTQRCGWFEFEQCFDLFGDRIGGFADEEIGRFV